MISDPSVPFDKQREAFNALPPNNTESDAKQIVLVRLTSGTTKARHYVAKKKAAAKKKGA